MDTRDILNVELLSTGTFFGIGSAPDGDTYTEADLDGIVEAAEKIPLKRPLKLGHNKEQQFAQADGLPAVGWVENLRRVGDKLLGDLKGVAGKVADLIEGGAYRARSAELRWDYEDADGTVYPRVFTGLALLGADIPAVTRLDDIVALYSEEVGELHAYTVGEEGESGAQERQLAVVLPLSEKGSYEWTRRQIEEALPGTTDTWWWVQTTYPEYAVVEKCTARPLGGSDRWTWIVPYSIDMDGAVALGDEVLWQKVASEQVFVSARDYEYEAHRYKRISGLMAEERAEQDAAGETAGGPEPETSEGAAGTAAATGLESQTGKDGKMKEHIYKALGLAPETSEEDALAQVRELAERRNYISRESEEFKALSAKAAEADEQRQVLYERDRKEALDKYEGSKFLPPDRPHWEKLYDADPETARTLLESAKPVIELGPSGSGGGGGEPRDLSDRDELHAAVKEYQAAHPEMKYEDALTAVQAQARVAAA